MLRRVASRLAISLATVLGEQTHVAAGQSVTPESVGSSLAALAGPVQKLLSVGEPLREVDTALALASGHLRHVVTARQQNFGAQLDMSALSDDVWTRLIRATLFADIEIDVLSACCENPFTPVVFPLSDRVPKSDGTLTSHFVELFNSLGFKWSSMPRCAETIVQVVRRGSATFSARNTSTIISSVLNEFTATLNHFELLGTWSDDANNQLQGLLELLEHLVEDSLRSCSKQQLPDLAATTAAGIYGALQSVRLTSLAHNIAINVVTRLVHPFLTFIGDSFECDDAPMHKSSLEALKGKLKDFEALIEEYYHTVSASPMVTENEELMLRTQQQHTTSSLARLRVIRITGVPPANSAELGETEVVQHYNSLQLKSLKHEVELMRYYATCVPRAQSSEPGASGVDMRALMVQELRRMMEALPRGGQLAPADQQALQQAHKIVVRELCLTEQASDVTLAYSLVNAHKYHGLRVDGELVNTFAVHMWKTGDPRLFNLVDVCTIFSNNQIDVATCGYMFQLCEVVGDHHRASTLLSHLKPEIPGVVSKLSEEARESLRRLCVIPKKPVHLFDPNRGTAMPNKLASVSPASANAGSS